MKTERIPRICPQCSTTFHITPYQADIGRRYCSRACVDASKQSTGFTPDGLRPANFWDPKADAAS